QLGNRIQHALRAFTPRDQKNVKAAAETFRANPKVNVEQAITELAVGEALVSFLDEKGRPTVVERAFILPPSSQIGPITPAQRSELIKSSLVAGQYEKVVDRESAYEKLKARAESATSAATQSGSGGQSILGGVLDSIGLGGLSGSGAKSGGRPREGIIEAAAKSAARAVGSQLGRQILRGVLGSIIGGKK
ncbi:MAG: helicase HerA-like domain-containing protein, partial [Burkholderiales bacterium]